MSIVPETVCLYDPVNALDIQCRHVILEDHAVCLGCSSDEESDPHQTTDSIDI